MKQQRGKPEKMWLLEVRTLKQARSKKPRKFIGPDANTTTAVTAFARTFTSEGKAAIYADGLKKVGLYLGVTLSPVEWEFA